jgi:hypothetical protein
VEAWPIGWQDKFDRLVGGLAYSQVGLFRLVGDLTDKQEGLCGFVGGLANRQAGLFGLVGGLANDRQVCLNSHWPSLSVETGVQL